MAVNFLDFPSVFKFTISSDCPCQAGYEAESLPSPTNKGFLAAYFKRPPVTITISFTDPSIIQLQKISFGPRVHGQCSTSISISARRNGDSKIIYLCRGTWTADTELVIIDGSANFRSHKILPIYEERRKERANVKTARIALPKHAALGDLCELLLTITSTKGGNAVALKDLKIFGQASMKIGRPEYENLAERLKAKIREDEEPSEISSTASKETIPTAGISPENAASPDVPEEFLDSLTFSIMQDPVILPSGARIDMSSLTKHEAVQAEFGRQLFDPFSGVTTSYRDIKKDTALQKRIDDFVHSKQAPSDSSRSADGIIGCSKEPKT